ncbi:MAG: TIGR02147 family protein [SAR324 cluster bacterium]|nr:TIGR02147 family protein [SAR324 cluster bacterium]
MLTLQKLGINIYAYLDSRNLIRDYCQLCKAGNSRYSLRWFAKEIGYGAPNYVKLIIDGDRNISEKRIRSFAELMGLKKNEREYFELLVHLSQAGDIESRDHYYQRIASIRSKKFHKHQLQGAQFDSLSSWLHLLIREMSFLKDFSDDVNWIMKRLLYKASPAEITKCLKDLETSGLLIREGGRLRASDSSITFPDEVRSLAIQKYHQGILKQADHALEQDLKQREYGSTIVATTPEKFKLVKEKLKKFRAEILELLDTEDGVADEIVVMAFQLFHVVESEQNQQED